MKTNLISAEQLTKLNKDLRRCEEEILSSLEEIMTDVSPTGPLLGYKDWNEEKRIIMSEIRKFKTGATRDSKEGKLEYKGFNSPLVLKRFAEYMESHRIQSDSTPRASDNWKNGIPTSAYMDSLWRHFMDLYLYHEGYYEECVEKDIEKILCAIIFNVNGYLHEVLSVNYDNKVDVNYLNEEPPTEDILAERPEEFEENRSYRIPEEILALKDKSTTNEIEKIIKDNTKNKVDSLLEKFGLSRK